MRNVPFSALLVALASGAAGASPHYAYVGKPDAQVYFGHIAYCELRGDAHDPKVVREGRDAADRAVPNTPLLPGDTIVTGPGRRCEARFDTGTVVRLDGATRLRIETILASALSRNAGVTNFLLAEGRIEVRYRHYEKSEVFQILTPTAAVKLRDRAVVTIGMEADGSTGVETRSGSAQVLFGRAADKTRRRTVSAGQRFAFGPSRAGGEAERAQTAELLDFRGWNEIRESEGSADSPPRMHRESPGLESSPPVVLDFAARSHSWGNWVSSDVYGSVWRPHDNDRPGWRPYLEGQWAPVQGDLFWVADEPWGWVPYHLGYWTLLTRHGWVWVPGSWFAPAWVMRWAPGRTLAGWRPMDVWDFYPDDPALSWFDADGGVETPPSTIRPPAHAVPRRSPPPAPEPPFPPERRRPREIQATYERVMKAPRASWSTLKDEAGLVRSSTVVLQWEKRSPERTAEAPRVPAASAAIAANAKPAEVQTTSLSLIYVPPFTESALGDFARTRLRDWNPDAALARAMGGRIYYSSHDNAVRCASCPGPLPRPESGIDFSRSGASSASQAEGGSSGSTPSAAPSAASPAGGRDGGRAGGGAPRDH